MHITLDFDEFKDLINSYSDAKPTQICLELLEPDEDNIVSLSVHVDSADSDAGIEDFIDCVDGNPYL